MVTEATAEPSFICFTTCAFIYLLSITCYCQLLVHSVISRVVKSESFLLFSVAHIVVFSIFVRTYLLSLVSL